jgi:Ran GTPase-activating protein (RanGAP) involved in mRNA processing and transport
VEPLSAALHSNKTLHELSLSWSNITNGEQKVAELLEHNNVLKVLKLGFFRSSKQGTEALMQALTNNTSLIELHLATDIGNEEIKVLTRVLTCHPALEVLTFNCTRITDGGVLALANAMKTNKSLRTLDLYSCSTAKCENAVALAEAIENHPTLKELRLDGLKIPSSVAITLLRNKTLTSLSIRDLEFPSDVRGNALAVKDEAKESLLAALNENWVLRSGQFGYSYGQSSLQPALKSCIMRNQEFYSLFLNVVLIKETHGSGVEKGMGIPNEIFGIVVGYLFSLYHHDHTKLTNASNK